MSSEFQTVIKKIKSLRGELFNASASFRAYEVIQEMRAPNILGGTEANRNAQAMGDYKGFFNIAEHAMNTDFLVSIAKLYDDHQQGTSLPKLLTYIEGNLKYLKVEDFVEYNKTRPDIEDRKTDYQEVTHDDLKEIRAKLNEMKPQIEKVKVLRDKKIAHLEVKAVQQLQGKASPKDFDASNEKIDDLTYQEIDSLISRASELLNKISSLINNDVAEFRLLKETVTQDSEQLIKLVRTAYDSNPSGIIHK